MKCLKLKDYDYSPKAKFQHKQALKRMDHLALRGTRTSIGEINSQRQQQLDLACVVKLNEIFECKDEESRKEKWIDFTTFLRSYKISISKEQAKEIYLEWRKKA